MKSDLLINAFNDQISQFMKDLVSVYPDDLEITKSKNYVINLIGITPNTLIKIWKAYTNKYKTEIMSGNVTFFLNKQYNEDIDTQDKNQTTNTLQLIERIRDKFSNMSEENKTKTVMYIQNLTQLSSML